jgi:ribosomal protein S18 acetylase RimI-like enzyme
LQLPFMHSDDHPAVSIRPMTLADRAAIAELIVSVENFNQSETDCALELVDIYLHDKNQSDYKIAVAEDSSANVQAYACWGSVPLTKGAFDLYWIATRPSSRGLGFGRALMNHVEQQVMSSRGRLLIIETSSKDSYQNTVGFYHNLGYEETARIKDFYDIGDDKLVFVKRIS